VLLKNCFALPKLLYILCASPSYLNGAQRGAFNRTVCETVCKISNVAFNDSTWMQAALPVKQGGLGFRRAIYNGRSRYTDEPNSRRVVKLMPNCHQICPLFTRWHVITLDQSCWVIYLERHNFFAAARDRAGPIMFGDLPRAPHLITGEARYNESDAKLSSNLSAFKISLFVASPVPCGLPAFHINARMISVIIAAGISDVDPTSDQPNYSTSFLRR